MTLPLSYIASSLSAAIADMELGFAEDDGERFSTACHLAECLVAELEKHDETKKREAANDS